MLVYTRRGIFRLIIARLVSHVPGKSCHPFSFVANSHDEDSNNPNVYLSNNPLVNFANTTCTHPLDSVLIRSQPDSTENCRH